MLRDLDEIVLPGITHWQSPRFFAYFPANASGPSILGDLVASGLGVQGMLWQTSPACTEVETHVLDWLVRMLDLPARFLSTSDGGGVIQDTASSSALCALVAARERATAGRTGREGGDGTLTAYTSTQAHSSIEKGVRIAGIGIANLRFVDVDGRYAMRPDALAAAIEADRAAGRRPFFVSATVGTTSSNAMDPLRPIGEICRRHGLWLHVDAAMSGTAALCPEFRWIHDGLEHADSYCFNPHKWMFTNFDCDAFWVADRASLDPRTERAARVPAKPRHGIGRGHRLPRLANSARPTVPCSQALVRDPPLRRRRACATTSDATSRSRRPSVPGSRREPSFEVAAPSPLNLVCFRHAGGDDANERIFETVNASGRIFLTHTKLDGRFAMRLSIGQTWTEEHHVRAAWEAILAAAAGTAS